MGCANFGCVVCVGIADYFIDDRIFVGQRTISLVAVFDDIVRLRGIGLGADVVALYLATPCVDSNRSAVGLSALELAQVGRDCTLCAG